MRKLILDTNRKVLDYAYPEDSTFSDGKVYTTANTDGMESPLWSGATQVASCTDDVAGSLGQLIDAAIMKDTPDSWPVRYLTDEADYQQRTLSETAP